MDPRIDRLRQDYVNMKELAARSEFVSIEQKEGDPPEKYVLHLTCKGIQRVNADGSPVITESFFLSVELHDEYPRQGPLFQILADITPVFHPNIANSGAVCYGDEGEQGWAPSMALTDVVVRIIRMIRYQNFGLESVWNEKAAEWAKENMEMFPLDERQIVRRDSIWDEIEWDDNNDDAPLEIILE